MELYPLHVFLTIAAEKSFSRAAEKLLRTQPAVSLALQRLELELGEKLIDRSAKDLVLTDAGQTVLEYARRFENLSQEMADQSEAFRARLEEIFESWVDRYAKCLLEAQQFGEIRPDLDVSELAEFWLNSWQGALLRAKTMRSTAPLRTFLGVMFGNILQAQA